VQVNLKDDLLRPMFKVYCLPDIWQRKMVLYKGRNIVRVKIQGPVASSEHV